MQTVYAKTAGLAWIEAVKTVLQNGVAIDGSESPITEVLELFVEVEDGQSSDEVLIAHADQKMVRWMVNENFGGSDPVLNWGYCYGMRLHDFDGIDQVEEIVKKLHATPEIKSATLSLMQPRTDFDNHMPCIMTIDFKIRQGRLHITGFFRSQDVGKKLYADILALGSMQQTVSKRLGVQNGHVKVFISSAHIYRADLEKAKKLLLATTGL